MGVIITKQGIEENSFTWEYYCDTYEDMESIAQENVTIGSYCTLLNGENGTEIYAGDGNHQWVLITPSIRDKYSADNDGKVILNGNALSQTNLVVNENGTYDTTLNNRIEVLIEPSLQNKTVTTNGVVTHDNNYYGLDQVTVNVPNSYEDEDEDKVVYNGELVGQTSRTVTENGTYDTTLNSEVVVNIETNFNLQSKTTTVNGEILPDEGYDGLSQVTVAVEGGATLQTKTITKNGTVEPDDGYDGFSEVTVNVSNSYEEEDEGKVVSSGELISQTSTTITENGTYDTTTYNEVVVNGIEVEPLIIDDNGTYTAPTGKAYSPVTVAILPMLQSKTVTQNGTVTPDQGYDGLSNVVVNVSDGGGATYKAVHVWTKNTGDSDASLYIQVGHMEGALFVGDADQITVLYSEALTPIEYAGIVSVRYNNVNYVWEVTALVQAVCNQSVYNSGVLIASFMYNVARNFIIAERTASGV